MWPLLVPLAGRCVRVGTVRSVCHESGPSATFPGQKPSEFEFLFAISRSSDHGMCANFVELARILLDPWVGPDRAYASSGTKSYLTPVWAPVCADLSLSSQNRLPRAI
jgi:hypothetical protein